jgi:hypothetical protein
MRQVKEKIFEDARQEVHDKKFGEKKKKMIRMRNFTPEDLV